MCVLQKLIERLVAAAAEDTSSTSATEATGTHHVQVEVEDPEDRAALMSLFEDDVMEGRGDLSDSASTSGPFRREYVFRCQPPGSWPVRMYALVDGPGENDPVRIAMHARAAWLPV